jgi:peptidoglycan-N-acetylglucosamine deacetylase
MRSISFVGEQPRVASEFKKTKKMDLRKILSTPLHVSRRHLVTATIALSLIAILLDATGKWASTPRFVLDPNHGEVTPVAEHSWHRAGDWLTGRKYAVLTFDDGPYGHGVDEQILGVLHRHHAHAMFFLVCSHIDASTSQVLGKIERDGHLIGNHSFDHRHLTQLGAIELRQQIEGCSARIAGLTGHRPHYFRPPFGSTSPLVRQIANQSGMREMLWNANSLDSARESSDQMLRLISSETDNHSILLMHDKPFTAAVLDQALTNLEQRGFEFVLPDDLPPPTDPGWSQDG